MKVHRMFGRDTPNYPGRVGIEIELEEVSRNRARMADLLQWREEADGSLRNGREYVSLPLLPDEVAPALDGLSKAIRNYNASFRCGTHLHVCMDDMEHTQLLAFLAIFCLLEPTLMHMAGEERQDNVFCMPLYATPTQYSLHQLADAWENRNRRSVLTSISRLWNKYSSINLLPLHNYGTVEVRMIPKYEGPESIGEWVNMLVTMREFSKQYDDPRRLWQDFEDNPQAFKSRALGIEAPDLPTYVMEYELTGEDLACAILGVDELHADDVDWRAVAVRNVNFTVPDDVLPEDPVNYIHLERPDFAPDLADLLRIRTG